MNSVDVESILRSIGLQGVTRRNSNIMACCPSHQERRPSWGVRKDAPYFHGCFSCGFKGTLPQMLRDKYGWTESKIKNVFGVIATQEPAKGFSFREMRFVEQWHIPEVAEEQLYPYALEKPAIKYLMGRGLTYDTIKKAEVLWHPTDQRVLFPWRWNGRLAGMTGRTVLSDVDESQKIIGYCDIKKSKLLYVPARKGTLTPGEVILVEGEIDALKVMQAGFKNVAALGHGRFSKQPAELLKSLPVKSLVLFFDNDRRGRELVEEAKEMVGNFCTLKEIDWGSFRLKDPGEMPEALIARLIKTAERKIAWPTFSR
jgi:DNA primase